MRKAMDYRKLQDLAALAASSAYDAFGNYAEAMPSAKTAYDFSLCLLEAYEHKDAGAFPQTMPIAFENLYHYNVGIIERYQALMARVAAYGLGDFSEETGTVGPQAAPQYLPF